MLPRRTFLTWFAASVAALMVAPRQALPPPDTRSTRDVWVTADSLDHLEAAHPAEHRWRTRDGGSRFGPRADGPTYRVLCTGPA